MCWDDVGTTLGPYWPYIVSPTSLRLWVDVARQLQPNIGSTSVTIVENNLNFIIKTNRNVPQQNTWFIFSCNQAALWMVQSVRLSVCLSVCHTFLTSMQKVKVRGHDPTFRFRTVTPVWIHIWWWNDTYSLMLLRRGALLFFKVIRQISRSHGAKIAEFDPDWAFPDCNSSLNSPMAMKCCTKLEVG